MNKNQELHELLGLEWIEDWVLTNSEGTTVRIPREDNPDYATDPRLVLREMMKREDWRGSEGFANYLTIELGGRRFLDIPLNLILDTTGKLRNLAIDWLNK